MAGIQCHKIDGKQYMLLLWQDAVFVYVQLYTQWFPRESWSNISLARCIRGTAMSVLCSCVSHDFVIKSLCGEAHYTKHTMDSISGGRFLRPQRPSHPVMTTDPFVAVIIIFMP